MSLLSQNPPKGTLDWMPEEFKIRSYIFDKWRKVCLSYGYKEYLTPVVESADLYRAKSGEDVGGAELVTFLDRGGRELCIRPEMTPSVTRMVSKVYTSEQKPIRLFSIANFMRNERPQRGRNREFWQLNVDMFGLSNKETDLEILEMSIEIMLAFDVPKNSFELHINHRGVIDVVLSEIEANEKSAEVSRILDKWHKLDAEKIIEMLGEIGINRESYELLNKFMGAKSCEELENTFPVISENESFLEIKDVLETLRSRGYGEYIKFKPDIIRGFDYYDGIIFEVFDKHPENNRALFGGGRYNGLASIFGKENFPSIGFAPGDEPMRLFLESHGMIERILEEKKDDIYYIPMIDDDVNDYVNSLAHNLRKEGKSVVCGYNKQNITKAIEYAKKANFSHIIIVGQKEKENGNYKICEFRTFKPNKNTENINVKKIENGIKNDDSVNVRVNKSLGLDELKDTEDKKNEILGSINKKIDDESTKNKDSHFFSIGKK